MQEYYEPYGRRKNSDFSSKESKAMYDYDPNFAVTHTIGTNHYEPAPLGNIPNNEPEFPEDEQPYQYWRALRDYDERLPIEPSSDDKKSQMNSDWDKLGFERYDYSMEDGDDDYNFNVHDNAFDAAGADGIIGRLNAFDDDTVDKKSRKARKFNGTLRSLRKK